MGSIFKALSTWRPDEQFIPTTAKPALIQSFFHTVSLCVPFLELNLLPFLGTQTHHAPIITMTTVIRNKVVDFKKDTEGPTRNTWDKSCPLDHGDIGVYGTSFGAF